jgi:hypothetical protein
MASQCRIEFYFRSADLLKMLKDNKKSKGIIISQEITQKRGPKGRPVNVVSITARPSEPAAAKATSKMAMAGAGGDEDIYGCPYPPGCTDEG